MRRAAIGIVLSFAACASRGKPATSQVEPRQEKDSGAPGTMDSERMKADITRQQRMEDEQRSRDDFIGRHQRP
jgi:hypothetical protein